MPTDTGPYTNLVARCDERWYSQYIDHFGFGTPVMGKMYYNQRYFVCSEYWDGSGPIFFYVGNEADVTLYLNATGLMWENAPNFHALIVFAEHRYFGKSLPYGNSLDPAAMNYLSAEQALEDYASLIRYLRESLPAKTNAFIGFGGSYGGMLGSWLRIKYPSAIDGVIAASAPILSFLGLDPPYDSASYAKIETADATPVCQKGVRASWDIIAKYSTTPSGRAQLTQIFNLCKPLNTANDAMGLLGWASNAISYIAMGNYPYPTAYITNGGCVMPAWPMNLGCGYFNNTVTVQKYCSKVPQSD
jgi:lysosomal Pro-X carboxypeptidase